MRLLQIADPEPRGGATVAFQSVVDLVGGDVWRIPEPNFLRQAWTTIGGRMDWRMRWLIRDVIRHHQPDVVHLHGIQRAGIAAIAACKDLGVPVVHTVLDYFCLCPTCTGWNCCSLKGDCHHTWSPAKGRDYPKVLKWALLRGRRERMRKWFNELDGIVCLSGNSRDWLVSEGIGVFADEPPRLKFIHVIPLPITVPEQEPRIIREWHDSDEDGVEWTNVPEKDPNLVLYLGGPAKHKGHDVFHAAAAIVKQKRPETTLLDCRPESREEALRMIAKASVLVVPEQWPNPGPVVVREAQLLGTAVVGSDIGGLSEMLRPWPCRANPSLPGQFAARILDFLNSPNNTFAPPPPDYDCIREKLMGVYRRAMRG